MKVVVLDKKAKEAHLITNVSSIGFFENDKSVLINGQYKGEPCEISASYKDDAFLPSDIEYMLECIYEDTNINLKGKISGFHIGVFVDRDGKDFGYRFEVDLE